MGDFLLVIIELFSPGAFVLSQFTRLTDGRTDRQTDGQMLIGKTALHTMQRGKKVLQSAPERRARHFRRTFHKFSREHGYARLTSTNLAPSEATTCRSCALRATEAMRMAHKEGSRYLPNILFESQHAGLLSIGYDGIRK